MIKGYATREKTLNYLNNHESKFRETTWFYCSPIAIGTHLGDMTNDDSELYEKTIKYCLKNGVNFIDTALNYRGMKSEKDIGKVLESLITNKEIDRSEFVISTKAGLLPGDKDAGLVPGDYLKYVLLKMKSFKKRKYRQLHIKSTYLRQAIFSLH